MLSVDLYYDVDDSVVGDTPDKSQLIAWIKTAIRMAKVDGLSGKYTVSLKVVDREAMQRFNRDYRGKNYPTDVLSFPFVAEEIEADQHQDIFEGSQYLGDLLICQSVLEEVAATRNMPINDHWAHILIHGILHLLGYDHIEDGDAEQMMQLEIATLDQFNIANPYLIK